MSSNDAISSIQDDSQRFFSPRATRPKTKQNKADEILESLSSLFKING